MAIRVRGTCPKCSKVYETDAPKGRVTWRGKCPKTNGCTGTVIARRIKDAAPAPAPADEPPAKPARRVPPKVTEYEQQQQQPEDPSPPPPVQPARKQASRPAPTGGPGDVGGPGPADPADPGTGSGGDPPRRSWFGRRRGKQDRKSSGAASADLYGDIIGW